MKLSQYLVLAAVAALMAFVLFAPGCSLFEPTREQSPISKQPLTREELVAEFDSWQSMQQDTLEQERERLDAQFAQERQAAEREAEEARAAFEARSRAEAQQADKRKRLFDQAVQLVEGRAREQVADLVLQYEVSTSESALSLDQLAAQVDAAARQSSARVAEAARAQEINSAAIARRMEAERLRVAQSVQLAVRRADDRDQQKAAFAGLGKQLVGAGVEAGQAAGIPGIGLISLAANALLGIWGLGTRQKAEGLKSQLVTTAATADGLRTQLVSTTAAAEGIVDSIDILKKLEPSVAEAMKKHSHEVESWQGEDGKALVATLKNRSTARRLTVAA